MLGLYARDFIRMLHEGKREGMMLCNGDAYMEEAVMRGDDAAPGDDVA
jgi:hypothetical protein